MQKWRSHLANLISKLGWHLIYHSLTFQQTKFPSVSERFANKIYALFYFSHISDLSLPDKKSCRSSIKQLSIDSFPNRKDHHWVSDFAHTKYHSYLQIMAPQSLLCMLFTLYSLVITPLNTGLDWLSYWNLQLKWKWIKYNFSLHKASGNILKAKRTFF